MSKISLILITKDEESAISECLSSIQWADEIILLDANSSDKTIEIANKLGAKTYISEDWQGFGVQKNRALEKASSEWILSIDADERISEALHKEILEAINRNDKNTAFEIPRLSSYCGQFIYHSGWQPDYVLRLFPRANGKFSDDLIHERVLFNGKLKKLKNPIIHLSYENLEEALDKVNKYSTAGAQMMHQRGNTSTLRKAIFRGFWTFFKTYFIKLGFLDGKMGLILAVSNAETTYYKYLKLFMLSKKNSRNH